ncbi:MAG: molybdenum cofactor guanylyltransferase [Leptolyngbya sp. SIO4C1]|nr:molybdenum cofactor guanylyltransferase [Leptolyngbya sp. SIO4C1]
MTNLAALILAGGQSQRMGQDKALLELAGESLLQRTCQVALSCTPQTFVVTPWPQRYQAAVPASVGWIQEPVAARGPLIGFAQGLRALGQPDWVLLLACDMPYLEGRVLQHWQAQLDQIPPAAIAALPRSAKGWEPLCGFYRYAALASLERAIAHNICAFQRWLATETVAALAAEPRLLTNCNTPEQWQQIIRQSHA